MARAVDSEGTWLEVGDKLYDPRHPGDLEVRDSDC